MNPDSQQTLERLAHKIEAAPKERPLYFACLLLFVDAVLNSTRLRGSTGVIDGGLKAIEGFAFLTFWHAEDQHGERERKAGYPTFDKLTCILCFVNDEESGHC